MSGPIKWAAWLVVAGALAMAGSALAWQLDLPRNATVSGTRVQLSDVATGPVPEAAGELVLLGRGQPGSCITLTRQQILRKLVEAGLARGVVLTGAGVVDINFQGQSITAESLRRDIRLALQPLVPAGQAGAPATWFDLELPAADLAVSGQHRVTALQTSPLVPGRNQIRVRVHSDQGHSDLNLTVVLHSYGEVATARLRIERETPLEEGLFSWSWLDLAELAGQPVTDRQALLGACAGRTLPAGDRLRLQDLKPVPVIRSGDRVELQIARGQLLVTVQAMARQAGCVGQTIPVRNELNGKLVNARVAGPGLVEWRQ